MKTTTYTASDLPEEIHSEEPTKDVETVRDAESVETAETVKNTETEPQESIDAEPLMRENSVVEPEDSAESQKKGFATESGTGESGSLKSEMTETLDDVEGTTSEPASEKASKEGSDDKETTKEEESEDSEKGGFTRGKLVKIFAMEVLAFVIFIFAIVAWFSMNEEVAATGLQIKVSAPQGMMISLGKTSEHYPSSSMNTDYLLTSAESPAPQAPELNGNDWTGAVKVDNYYKFGKMIPASSTTGEHIYFTPDAAQTGKELKSNPRYYQADGYTDGYLKHAIDSSIAANSDSDSLAATAYIYTSTDAASGATSKATAWPAGTDPGEYDRNAVWNDTNDDGYYVDIPIWIKTPGTENVSLSVEGYVTKGDGTTVASGDALYKATRVAILKETESVSEEDPEVTITSLVPAVSKTAISGEDPTEVYKNIIPLQDSTTYGSTNHSILDSQNFTDTRHRGDSTIATDGLYGLVDSDPTGEDKTEAELYNRYYPYASASVVDLSESAPMVKRIIRIWLDGEDKDCWNSTAGQNWIINIRFNKIP